MKNFSSFHQLGPLEQEMLEAVWARGSATAGEIHVAFQRYVYTTINTTLDRLYKKGLLTRVQERNRFRYSAMLSRAELQRIAAVKQLRVLLDDSSDSPLLSHLVESVADHDPKLLDQLVVMIEQKRRNLQRT